MWIEAGDEHLDFLAQKLLVAFCLLSIWVPKTIRTFEKTHESSSETQLLIPGELGDLVAELHKILTMLVLAISQVPLYDPHPSLFRG